LLQSGVSEFTKWSRDLYHGSSVGNLSTDA